MSNSNSHITWWRPEMQYFISSLFRTFFGGCDSNSNLLRYYNMKRLSWKRVNLINIYPLVILLLADFLNDSLILQVWPEKIISNSKEPSPERHLHPIKEQNISRINQVRACKHSGKCCFGWSLSNGIITIYMPGFNLVWCPLLGMSKQPVETWQRALLNSMNYESLC